MKISMLLLLVLFVVHVRCSYAQVVYPAAVISFAQGNCAADADRQAAIARIRLESRNIVRPTSTCDGTSGWNRIAFLNMSDPTMQCPSTWREIRTSSTNVRACGGIALGDRACDSHTFPNTDRVTYSQVCGRMVGYHTSAPDAFRPYHQRSVTTIEGSYLDGVSLTHGPAGSRQHIWSFAAGEGEISSSTAACPCNSGTSVTIPPFVGNDYFCESSSTNVNCAQIYFGDDPLWDGMSCQPSSTCCGLNTPPYFTKTLSSPTTNDLEVRLCSYDAGCPSEIAVSFIDLYVK